MKTVIARNVAGIGMCVCTDNHDGTGKIICSLDSVPEMAENHDALVERLKTINELSMAGADVESYLDEHVVPLLSRLEGE